MHGYQYNKTTGEFIIDVPHWDGETQPESADEAITDKQPMQGAYKHKFDAVTQTWGEGMPQSEIDAIKDANRVSAITNEATKIIEDRYSPLKQRKLMSIAISLQDKKLSGAVLTVSEEAALQQVRDANAWIASVRNVENAAIADGTLFGEVVWP